MLGLLVGTIIIAIIAMVISVPLAIGMAIFINEYAPAAVKRALTSVVDLLAALPSLLFGIWGFFALQDRLVPAAQWISTHLSVIPFFKVPANTALVQSGFDAGVVVALMTLPIITSVSRDVMAQVPRDQCEGALALGGTRWGMIRDVILPFGRSGIVGAALLGFGRALGETIAVVAHHRHRLQSQFPDLLPRRWFHRHAGRDQVRRGRLPGTKRPRGCWARPVPPDAGG